MPISVRITSVSIRTESSPTPTVERTARAEVSYLIIYPDNSPVTTSNNNSTLVNVIRTSDGSIVSQLPLSLTDASVGKWSAVWVPSFSANLSTYHFELTPVGFDDSYGNKGRGGVVLSDEFRVAAATPELSFEMSPTAQRTENVTVTVIAKYHDGSYFVNVTLFTASITSAVATTTPVPLVYNATTNQISGTTKIPVNAALGNWRITATVRDAFDNTGSGAFILQVIKATIGVVVKTPQAAERTTTLTVDAKLTYPDNTTVSPSGMPKGLNATLSVGNFTWFLPMSFNGTTGRWVAGYVLSQNATLGDYSITLGVVDAFGNAGDFAGTSKVVPARFRFALPQQSSKADPVSYVNIPVFVTYPNGTSLKNDVGEVMATFQNSTGTFTLPMAYNATDDRWHLLFLTPNTGLTFGVTLTFSFDATDMFGNAGSAPKAYDLIIGAGIQYLILAAIAGSIVPIALLAWAIFAISARRRKYKP